MPKLNLKQVLKNTFASMLFIVFASACSGVTNSDLVGLTGVTPSTTTVVTPGGTSSGSSTPTPTPSGSASIVMVSGSGQSVPVNTQASSALIVLVRDANSQPIANEVVTFLVNGPGTVSSVLVSTNASGLASVNFTATGSTGTAIVTATSAQGSVDFTQTVVAFASYSIQIISGNSSTDTIGATLAPLKVRVFNGSGAPAGLVSVTYSVQTGNGSFSGASSTTILTDSNGYAEATFTLGTTGGNNTIRAALTSAAGVFTTFTETGSVPGNSTIDLSQSTIALSQSSSQANGTNLVTVTVLIKDQYGNLIPNAAQNLIVSFSPAVGAWVSGATMNYSSTGTYTNTYRVGSTATTVVFSAYIGVAAFTSGTTSLILNTGLTTGAQGASLTVVSGIGQTVQFSQTASAPLKVVAVDSLGIPISGSTVTFTVNTAGGGSVTDGTTTATSVAVTTASDGTAQVSFIAGSTSGAVTVTASSLQGNAPFSITVQDLTGYTIEKINSGTTDNQTGFLNAQLSNTIKVRVLNGSAAAVAGLSVRFQCQSVNCGQFTNGQNTIDTTTNASGIAEAAYYLGTAAGVYTIRAIIPPQATIYTDFAATASVDPASTVSLSNTLVALSSSSVTADGNQSVIATVALKDQYGNTIPNDSKTVAVTPNPSNLGAWSGGSFIGSSGVYTRSYSVGSTAGSIQFTGAVNGSTLTSTAPTLTLNANNSPVGANTTISALNGTLTANGSETTTIQVTLYDLFNNPISQSGHTVVLSATTGTLGAVSYHSGSGTYRATFTAPSSAGSGSAVISVTSVNGNAVTGKTTTITLSPGTASTTLSTFSVPSRIIKTASQAQTLTVTLVDSNLNPITNATSVTITKATSGGGVGAMFGTLANSGVATHVGSGVYTVSLTAPATLNATNCPVATPCIDTLTATAVVSGVSYVIGTTRKVQYAGLTGVVTPTAANSIFSLNATTAAAGLGQSTIIATVTLRNASNEAFKVGGFASSIAVTVAFSTPTIVVADNDDGTYTVTIPSPATSNSGNLTIQYGGSNIAGIPTTISFFGAPSLTNSIVSLSTSTFNGPNTATVRVALYDSNNFGIPTCTIPNFNDSNVRFTENGNTSLSGSITCSVVSGVATYSQTIDRTSSPTVGFETVTVGAEFNLSTWQALTSTTILTITPPNLAGVTINCANIASYQGSNLYVTAGTLTIDSWVNGSTTCGNGSFTFASLTVDSTGILTHTAATATNAYGVDITVTGDVTITGTVNAFAKGYLAGYTTSTGVPTTVGAAASGAGGSHGGSGAGASTNAVYDSVSDPTYPGAGGSTGCAVSTPTGGGLVRISAANMVVNGIVNASAANHNANDSLACAGAGGSIKITVSGALTGTGRIIAHGGKAGLAAGSWGGGGRIALYGNVFGFSLSNVAAGYQFLTADLTYTSATQVNSGTLYLSDPLPSYTLSQSLNLTGVGNSSYLNLAAGTTEITIPSGYSVTLPSTATTLKRITNNGTLNFGTGNLTVTDGMTSSGIINANTGNLIVSNGNFSQTNGTFSLFTGTVNVSGDFVQTAGTITHALPSTTTYQDKPRIDITAANISLVSVTAAGRGFMGGLATGCSLRQSWGYTSSSVLTLACMSDGQTGAGGNHLAKGGGAASNSTWGNIHFPNLYGGGGIMGGGGTGGYGGGIIQLVTPGTLDVKGPVSANGASGTGSGGGAGGSLYINAGVLTSSNNLGVISANGANGATAYGGAAGIVRIYTTSGSYSGTIGITATPGTGVTANGGAGSSLISTCTSPYSDLGYCIY